MDDHLPMFQVSFFECCCYMLDSDGKEMLKDDTPVWHLGAHLALLELLEGISATERYQNRELQCW